MQKTTTDGILNKRIYIEQPKEGFRIAVDTVLLAAATPAKAGQKIMDMGCGVGGAMLALACRVRGVSICGVEIQKELVELCNSNINHNKLDAVLKVLHDDISTLPSDMFGEFDFVMANPPYHESERHNASANPIKRIANTESDVELEEWISTSCNILKKDGSLILIHKYDRLDEIRKILKAKFGKTDIKPVLPKLGANPKRVIIAAKMGVNFFENNCLPLVLHNSDGTYTKEANAILRGAEQIEF